MSLRWVLILSVVILVVVSVTFVAVGVGMAAPVGQGERPVEAVPAGAANEAEFACMTVGISGVLVDEPLDEYFCSFAGENWVCGPAAIANVVSCSLGDHAWTCAEFPTGGASDCSDEGDGSYGCAYFDDSVSCTTSVEGAKDFNGCYMGTIYTHTCATDQGQLVCTVFPPSVACTMLAGIAGLWADADCDGELSTRDNQAVLRNVLSQAPLSQTDPCPDVGSDVVVGLGPQSEPAAAPLGVNDASRYHGCVNTVVGALLVAETVVTGDYGCNFDGTGWGCSFGDLTELTCVSGLVEATCVINTGGMSADCGDNQGGSYSCIVDNEQMDCTAQTDGMDFRDCDFDEGDAYTCMTPDGQFVCIITLFHYDCGLVPAVSALWADADCDGELSTRDNQSVLRIVLSQAALTQTEPCPDVGNEVQIR